MPQLDSRVRYGIVGAGAIAQTYFHAFQASDRCQLAAVADVRVEAAAALGQAAGCASFQDHRRLADQSLDAVVVCTPPSTHVDICNWFLEKGIPVLCEKPLAIDVASAVDMIETARRHKTPLTMASKFRYVADVVRARELIQAGTIGDVLLFENVFASRVDMTRRWNSDPEVSGGGVLIDNGTHSVDIIRYFLGPLRELMAVEGKRVQTLQVEDTVRLFVRTASGVMGSVDLSWSLNKEQPAFISVYGTGGTLLVGWRESKYRRSGDDQWTVFGAGYDKITAFRSQIDNFAGYLRGREPLVITSQDALASVEVVEAAYRALDNAAWEPIGDAAQDPRSLVSV